MSGQHGVALWTHDEELADVVGSVAAAAQTALERVTDPTQAVGLLLVGADMASGDGWRRVPPGLSVVLVGEDAEGMARASMEWGARVVALPSGRAWLASLLAGGVRGPAGEVVVVLGAGGGVGTSTLAVGLATELQRSGRTVALLDGDAASGGIDLLLGAEGLPGWRWSSLLAADGELGDLRGAALTVEGMTVVSQSRTGAAPGSGALRSVAHALCRDHQVCVVDAGRDAGVLASLPHPSGVVLAADARVASAAAASRLIEALGAQARRSCGLALRGGKLAAAEMADSLTIPCWATIPDDRALARAADMGVLPHVAAGRAWQRAIRALAAEVVA